MDTPSSSTNRLAAFVSRTVKKSGAYSDHKAVSSWPAEQSAPQTHINIESKTSMAQDPYHLVGTTLNNRYVLEWVAGPGGMSLVYCGLDLKEQSKVAVKVLRPDLLIRDRQAQTFSKLFLQEAKAMRMLVHPNIVSVYDNGISNGIAYIVMEWLEGHTVAEELFTVGRFSLEQTATVLKHVCQALEVAHRQKIIHLDLKPNNIFLLDEPTKGERIKVIDFGLARIMNSTVGTTLSRYVGTPFYSAPEVFNNKASRSSDIYSLGVTTYEMLTGHTPFSTSQINAVIRQHLEQPPPQVRRERPEVPELIEELIIRALSKSPGGRPHSAKSFYEEFSLALKSTVPPELSKRPSPIYLDTLDAYRKPLTYWEKLLINTAGPIHVLIVSIGIIAISCFVVAFASIIFLPNEFGVTLFCLLMLIPGVVMFFASLIATSREGRWSKREIIRIVMTGVISLVLLAGAIQGVVRGFVP